MLKGAQVFQVLTLLGPWQNKQESSPSALTLFLFLFFFFSIRAHFCKGLAMPLLRFIYLLPLSVPLLFTSQRGSASLTYKRNAQSSSKTANTLWSLAGLAPSLHSCLAKFLFSLHILMASTSPTPGSLRTTWTKFSSAAVLSLILYLSYRVLTVLLIIMPSFCISLPS